MKKILVGVIATIMLLSLFGCKQDPNAEEYNRANALFIEGKYAEAKTIYQILNDYSNSVEMVERCTQKEIENQLEGRWSWSPESQAFVEFKHGRVNIGTESDLLTISGDYWIDFKEQIIYICNDKAEDSTHKGNITIGNQSVQISVATIVGYTKMYKYTYDNGRFQLLPLDEKVDMTFIKQESEQ